MKKRNGVESPARERRRHAEALVAARPEASPNESDARRLVHELQVHQVELELQNEELREAQAELEKSRDRYLDLYEYSPVGYLSLTPAGRIERLNHTSALLLGRPRDALLQKPLSAFVTGEDQDRLMQLLQRVLRDGKQSAELELRRSDGTTFCAQLDCRRDQGAGDHPASAANAGTLGIRIALTDITPLKEHEQQLQHLAHFDILTKLPNRALLSDRLRQAMTQTHRRGQHLAVAYLDLDGFKHVNDDHGHEIGDQVLMTVAARMKDALREGDTLARLGGDEFVAVLLDLEDISASAPLLTRLLATAAQPVHLGSLALHISASLGVTFFPQPDDADADQLLRQADQAMYRGGGNRRTRRHAAPARLRTGPGFRHRPPDAGR